MVEKEGRMTDEAEVEVVKESPAKAPAKTEANPYPERSDAEASEGVVNIDPSNPAHQADRLAHSKDYQPEDPPGYQAPDYS